MRNMFLTAVVLIVSSGAYAENSAKNQIVELTVTEKGFEPSSVDVKSGESVTLNVTRKTDKTCATQVQIPSMKIKKDLPLNQVISINLGKLDKGEIRFACGMGMQSGVISVK